MTSRLISLTLGIILVHALERSCVETGNGALTYSQLADADWAGDVSGFCGSFFTESDLLKPIHNFSCAGDGGEQMTVVKNSLGGLTMSCQAALSQIMCLFHFPKVSNGGELVLPCTYGQFVSQGQQIASHDRMQRFLDSKCRDSPAQLVLDVVDNAVRLLDALLEERPELLETCQVVDQSWIPDRSSVSCPFPLQKIVEIDFLSTEFGCAEPCPPHFSQAHLHDTRAFVLALNSISLVAVLAVMFLRRKASSALFNKVWNLLICIAGVHSTVLMSALSTFEDDDIYKIACDPAIRESVCKVQGSLMGYFLKACASWWIVMVLNLCGTMSSDTSVVSYWFGYMYPAILMVLALATNRITSTDEYPWCFIASQQDNGLWQFWFFFGDLVVLLIIALAAVIHSYRRKLVVKEDFKVKIFAGLVGVSTLGLWLAMSALRFAMVAHHSKEFKLDLFQCLFENLMANPSVDPSKVCGFGLSWHVAFVIAAIFTTCAMGTFVALALLASEYELIVAGVRRERKRIRGILIRFDQVMRPNRKSNAVVLFGGAGPHHGTMDTDGTLVFDFVILGGGPAAFSASMEFALSSGQHSVAVVSRDANGPYCPKTLVQRIAANGDVNGALQDSEQWYRDNNIALMLHTTILTVDAESRVLIGTRTIPESNTTTNVRVRASRALIIATGAQPLPGPPVLDLDRSLFQNNHQQQQHSLPPPSPQPLPPCPEVNPMALFQNNQFSSQQLNFLPASGQPSGLFALRSFETGLELNNCLSKATSLVVVGGGFLGLDVAYMARSRGLDVTLVSSSPHILRKVFTPVMSEMYQKFFANNGVKMLLSTKCTAVLSKDGAVVGVQLSTGIHLPCDLVVIACGVRPNVDLFRGQLQLEKGTANPGILVDPFLVTSVPGVYAIGDVCAMRYSQHNPGAIRHNSHAVESGRHVVRCLLHAVRATETDPSTHRISKVLTEDKRQKLEAQLRVIGALVPGSHARPYTPHPTYDVNHFHLRGYVSGDRLGPDFCMIGEDMGPKSKLVTFWFWESRVVGAYVSNPTQQEKDLLDEATREQWYIQKLPELRALTDARRALEHVRNNARA